MMVARLTDRYGHRGCWLMLLGGLWVVFGTASALDPPPEQAWVLVSDLPPLLVAMGWWVTGLIAISNGALGKSRDDTIGHVCLYLMPAIKLVSYGLSGLGFLVSSVLVWIGWVDHPVGYAGGVYTMVLYLLTSSGLALAASWPNPAAPAAIPVSADLWIEHE